MSRGWGRRVCSQLCCFRMGKPLKRTAFVSELKYGHRNNAVLYQQPFSVVRISVR